ncbi:OmpH family outer membrane protein [Candidatus Pelagibacter sp.]|jgi:Skp family chaperone for outer membrane proteins|nr:OmpH family outer membrane protein [Candidatus Pelagibacter sp.]
MFKVFFFILIFISNAYSNNSVVAIDINYILKNSNQGKQLFSILDKEETKQINDLNGEYQILKDKELSLINKKDILDKDIFEKEITKLRNDIKIYNDKKNEVIKDFNDLKNKKIQDLLIKINKEVIEYSRNNDVLMVVDKKNIIMIKSDYDITKKILIKFNE